MPPLREIGQLRLKLAPIGAYMKAGCRRIDRSRAIVFEIEGIAQVAQLVEHVTENHGVGGSIPPLGTITPYFS
jgi:hypothetical protein